MPLQMLVPVNPAWLDGYQALGTDAAGREVALGHPGSLDTAHRRALDLAREGYTQVRIRTFHPLKIEK